RHHLITWADAISDLRLTLGHIARNRCPDLLPREFDIGIDKFIPGDLYVRMAYSGWATDARLRRLEISSSCPRIGFEGRPLVLGILQHLFRHRAARERLLVANDIVAYF